MVAIIAGSGSGLFKSSANLLGGAGQLGQASLGRAGDSVTVNAATGNLLVGNQDEFLVGLGPDAAIGRSYNSIEQSGDRDNGDHWRHSTTKRVFGFSGAFNAPGGSIKRMAGDGSVTTYAWGTINGVDAYWSTDGNGAHDYLNKSGSRWFYHDGGNRLIETYEEAETGYGEFRILYVKDSDNNTLTYSYVANSDKLDKVTTENNEWVKYYWSGNNVSKIETGYTDTTAKTLTRTRYGYDGSNRLTSVTSDLTPEDNSVSGTDTYVTTYTYEGTSNRIDTITQKDGSSLAIDYDGSGRVTSLTQLVASGDTRITTIAYNSGNSIVTLPDGNKVKMVYDGSQRLKEIWRNHGEAHAQKIAAFTYDSAGNVTQVTNGDGETTTYTYDVNGNMTKETDPLGNTVEHWYTAENRVWRTRTYGDSNLSTADPNAVNRSQYTRYTYDGEGHLRYMVNAEGRVTEYRYNSNGTLLWTIEYPEHYFGTGSAQITESELTTWRNGLADRSSTKLYQHFWDARGNLTETRAFGTTKVDGGVTWADVETREYFIYDQAGQLRERHMQGEASETFLYDGMGRLTVSTAADGKATSIVFHDSTSETVITTSGASGNHVVTKTFNKAGELISSSQTAGWGASFTETTAYDKLGRLRYSKDGAGDKTYYVYDDKGRLVGEVNHHRHLIEYKYDDADRLIATARYYNEGVSAAQATTLEDPNNTLTIANLRPSTHSRDIWEWTVYDNAGRVIQTIDGAGGVTRFWYDKSNNLVKTQKYYNTVAISSFKSAPPTSLISVPANSSKDAVTRTFYDRLGHVRATLDGEGYFTRFDYDRAGQKTVEIRFDRQVSSSLWANGTYQQVSGDLSGSGSRVVRNVYDSRGLLRFQLTDYNYITSYEYNAAGKVHTTIVHAAPLSGSDYTYDAVKAQVASSIANNTNDRESFSVYNANGQLAYTVDAENAVTGYSYNGHGELTKVTQYEAERTTDSLPSIGTMDSWASSHSADAGNRVTRNYYTADGMLRFSVDAEGYITRHSYGGANLLTRTVVWDTAIVVSDSSTISNVNSQTGGTWTDYTYSYDAYGRSSSYDGLGARTVNWVAKNGFRGDLRRDQNHSVDEARIRSFNDGAGRVSYAAMAHGDSERADINYTYDGMGNRLTVNDGNSKTTTYEYDRRGLVTKVTDAAGGITLYEYNAFGEVVKVTDPNGGMTFTYYDDFGRVIRVRDAESYVTKTNYTAFGDIQSVIRYYNKTASAESKTTIPSVSTHSKDAATSFLYDKMGRVTKTTDAQGFYESYTYNAFGERATVKARSETTSASAGSNNTTTYSYDRRGQLVAETLPIESYDNNGTLIASTVTNRYEYDARGNRTKMIEAHGLAEERVTEYVYDKADRLVQTKLPVFVGKNRSEYYTYDGRGNVTSTTNGAGNKTVFYYDDLDRKVVEIGPAGTYTKYTYDKNGNVTQIRVYDATVIVPVEGGSEEEALAAPSGTSRLTMFTYDNLNRMTKSSVNGVHNGTFNGTSWVANANNFETFYTYDANGNVIKVKDPNGNDTYIYYDKLGRKSAQVDAEKHLTIWDYDSEGNVTLEHRFTNPVGTQDSLNPNENTTRQALIDSAWYNLDDRMTAYAYDKVGNRVSESRYNVAYFDPQTNTAVDPSGHHATVSYLYNGLGQVVRKTEATGDQVNYTYDDGGRLIEEKRASFTSHQSATVTPEVDYYYNGRGDLARTVAAGAGDAAARVTRYAYDGDVLRWVQDARGTTRYYWYDNAKRVTISDYLQRHDSAGVATADKEGTRYAYDAAGRVTEEWRAYKNGDIWYDVGPRTYTTYNAHGEAVEIKTGGVSVAQAQNKYDAAGRLWATNAGDGIWKFFGYDKNGNQTVAITSAGINFQPGHTFQYAFDRIGWTTVNATYTQYDKRNLAIKVVEELRQLEDGVSQNLETLRSYNAFGEVATETDATGAKIAYSYNTLGKHTRSENPAVEIMMEDGTKRWVKPSEDYYYDASGRLVAQRDANGTYASGGTDASNATSKAADTGNLTLLTLLAGTGYGGSEAQVTKTIAADGGITESYFDIHADTRKTRILVTGNGSTPSTDVWRTTTQTFDKMGNLRQANRYGGLVDYYRYDEFGQRIQHWNNLTGSGNKELTDYDAQGRVIETRAFGGDITETSYNWDNAYLVLPTTPSPTGGWEKVTEYKNTLNSGVLTVTEKSDLFGHMLSKTDLDGRLHNFEYDFAGRLSKTYNNIAGYAEINYSYYNTGLTRGQSGNAPEILYKYDEVGRRTYESNKSYNWQNSQWEWLKRATVSYDALGRLLQYEDQGGPDMPYAKMVYSYDANGNVMATSSTYKVLDKYGNPASQVNASTKYNRYDSMNRLVVAEGTLSNGQISYGSSGTSLGYNKAGDRVQQWTTTWAQGGATVTNPYTYQQEYHTYSYQAQVREDYLYNSAGQLYQVKRAEGGFDYASWYYQAAYGNPLPQENFMTAPGTGLLEAQYTYDLMGRLKTQKDFVEGSTTNTEFDKTVTYDAKGQITFERTYTKIGSDTMRADATHTYLDYDGNYALGQVGKIDTINYKNNNNSQAADTLLQYRYVMYEKATLSQSIYKPNKSSGTTYYNNYQIDSWGYTRQVDIIDGRPRRVIIKHDENNQILSREEDENSYNRGNPRQIYYYFNGKQLGEVSNDGTTNVDYQESVAQRGAVVPSSPGPFRSGSLNNATHTDFNQHLDYINTFAQSSSERSSYTVQTGDSLQSIAASVWGDASLWYKVAEANGLSGNARLTPGQSLALPTNVVRSHNNTNTFKTYDPGKALGDISPTDPKPQQQGKKGCGGLGAILLTVVALAVTLVTAGAALAATTGIGPIFGANGAIAAITGGGLIGEAGLGGAIAIGAGSAAVGSSASQGIGVATGIQEKFSWRAVGLAAIGGGVTAGLGSSFGGDWAAAAGRGALSSAITQGVGVATGLQDNFDWAGVAAAGIGAGAGHAVSGSTGSGFGGRLASSAAGAIANAATRSAINGESFGRNLLAAIPDVVAQALGGLIGNALQGGLDSSVAKNTAKSQSYIDNLDPLITAEIASLGGRIFVDGDGNVRISGGLDPQVVLDSLKGANHGFVSGSDVVSYTGENLYFIDTAPDRLMVERGISDIGGVRIEGLSDGVTLESNYFGYEGEGVVRLFTGVYEGSRLDSVLYFGGTAVVGLADAGVNVRISEGARLTENAYLNGVRRANLAIYANHPSLQAGAPFTLGGGYSTNVTNLQIAPSSQITRGRQQWAHGSYFWGGGNLAFGSLGYLGAYVTGAFATGLSFGREGSFYANPRDLKDAPILELAIGGLTSLRTSSVRMGSISAAERGVPRVSTLVDTVDAPNPLTGAGYGVNNPPVRISGEWSRSDIYNALYGRSPKGLGGPHLHHADQMPGAGIHEVLPADHLGNSALHPNTWNQGVTRSMRTQDANLHWWYRAREQGADAMFPNHIYD